MQQNIVAIVRGRGGAPSRRQPRDESLDHDKIEGLGTGIDPPLSPIELDRNRKYQEQHLPFTLAVLSVHRNKPGGSRGRSRGAWLAPLTKL